MLPLAHVVVDVGGRVQGTWELVDEACASEVALRNEKALRYAVPPAVWEAGRSIGEWVEATFKGEAAGPPFAGVGSGG